MIIFSSDFLRWLKGFLKEILWYTFSHLYYGEGVREINILWFRIWYDPNLISHDKPQKHFDYGNFSPKSFTFCWKIRPTSRAVDKSGAGSAPKIKPSK